MKRLLILGASEFQIPLINQAKSMGIYTCVIDINPDAYAMPYADEFYQCSLKDSKKVLEIAKQINPDGVTVGMCDVAVCTAAKICEELDLPGISYEVAKRATDKYLMIDTFKKNNVAHPMYQLISKENINNQKVNIPFPIISKPIDMAGSRGISLIRNKDELSEALEYSVNSSDCGGVIIEEYMEGPEVSVEIIVVKDNPTVIQVTDKMTSGAPHFMEIGHSQPSRLDQATIDSVKELACSAVKALGLSNCIAHAEIIICKDGPKMVEIGARMGGGGIHQQLIELSTGINMQEFAIKFAFGEDVNIPKSCLNKGSAIRFIPAQEGFVQAIENVEQVKKEKLVKYVKIFCEVDRKYNKPKDNSGRFGYVIAQGDKASDAMIACERALDMIEISVLNCEAPPLEVVGATEEDYEDYYNIRCEKGDIFWMGHMSKPEYNYLKKVFMERLDDSTLRIDGKKRIYMIKINENNVSCNVGFVMLSNVSGELEIGISIIDELHGKGLGTAAVMSILEIAKQYSRRVCAWIRDDNVASQMMFLKNGFQRTEIYETKLYPEVGKMKLRKYVVDLCI